MFGSMNLQRWKKLGERLSRMDRAELRVRLRQKVSKWQDGFLSLMGFDFTLGNKTQPVLENQHFSSRPSRLKPF